MKTKQEELEEVIFNLMSTGDNTAKKLLQEYKNYITEENVTIAQEVDDILSQIENTVKGPDGDSVTKARGLSQKLIFKPEKPKLQEIKKEMVYTGSIPQCPHCNKPTQRTELDSMSTETYYPPLYNEQGINTNPDRNIITIDWDVIENIQFKVIMSQDMNILNFNQ